MRLRFLLLSCLVLFAVLPAWSAERISVVSTDYPPYFSPGLPEQGTVTAIARAAFEAAGYQVTVEFRPWARLMAEVEAGQFDAVVAVWYKAEREAYIAYSDPLVNTHIGFYGRRDERLDVHDLAALKPYVIGTVRGYANPPAFDSAGLHTDETVDDVTNLRKLAAGRLDLVLADKALADYLITKQMPGGAQVIEWRDPPIQTMPLFLGMARKRSGYQQKLAAFNKGLAEIHRNGEFDRIIKRLPLAQ